MDQVKEPSKLNNLNIESLPLKKNDLMNYGDLKDYNNSLLK